MTAEVFAEWLRRQGHNVVRTASTYWFDTEPRIFQAFPYHWVITPSEEELRGLMHERGILALRYSTPLDAPRGMVSYHVILKGPYAMETLRSKPRNSIRTGLNHCSIERIPFERLSEEGWGLQQDTLQRQRRSSSMSQSKWRRICQAASDLPGFEAWGAVVDEELAASILTARVDDTRYILYAQSRSKFLVLQVNNTLFYSVGHDTLCREKLPEIFCGLHSLDAPASVDQFKFRIGFTPKPVRQQVVFHPWFQPFANSLTHEVMALLLQLHPRSFLLAKAEGMLRFYLQGKRPVHEQRWPECLIREKANLMQKEMKTA